MSLLGPCQAPAPLLLPNAELPLLNMLHVSPNKSELGEERKTLHCVAPGPEKSGILKHKCMLHKRVELFLRSLFLRSLLPIYRNQDCLRPQALPPLPQLLGPSPFTSLSLSPGLPQSYGVSACSEAPHIHLCHKVYSAPMGSQAQRPQRLGEPQR